MIKKLTFALVVGLSMSTSCSHLDYLEKIDSPEVQKFINHENQLAKLDLKMILSSKWFKKKF